MTVKHLFYVGTVCNFPLPIMAAVFAMFNIVKINILISTITLTEKANLPFPSPQLIRSSIDNIINLILSLFLSKKKPAITLEDPNIKYALKLIDKEVRIQCCDQVIITVLW